MALSFDEIWVYGGQLIVAQPLTTPKALGQGLSKIDWSSYIQGSLQVGAVDDFGEGDYPGTATVMVGRTDTKTTPLSINTRGNVLIEGDGGTSYSLEVTGGEVHFTNDLICDAISPSSLASRFSDADDRPKPFDIKHPSKEGWRLRYACIEGPEVGVYCRGRVRNEKIIGLPSYWKDLVHIDSISVQLQPIGAHQDIIVKRWDDQYIYLQAQGGLPINCFYHVYAERKDINPLITEYEGEKCSDYPDPNHHSIPEAERSYNDDRYRSNRNTITG